MSEYEFSAQNARVIKRVALWLKLLAIILGAGGILGIAIDIARIGTVSTGTTIISLLQSAAFIALGIVMFRPADNFERVATTEGRDISEVMTGLADINFAAKATIVILILMIALDVVQIALG
jgi:hypothetical protein